jgi:hypothetical protein
MPIPFFVWIAIALAVLMVGGGAAVSVSKLPEVVKPIAESADSFLAPLGTGLAIAFVVVVVVVLFSRMRRGGA